MSKLILFEWSRAIVTTGNKTNGKKYTEAELDLGLLILRIGGPGLVHTLHVQGKLPHSSVLYKSTQNKINIDCSIHSNYKNLIENNIKKFFENKEGFYTISMDEIHIIPRIRWNPLNNEIMGFCYNHSKNIRLLL